MRNFLNEFMYFCGGVIELKTPADFTKAGNEHT